MDTAGPAPSDGACFAEPLAAASGRPAIIDRTLARRAVLRFLRQADYHFVTPSPATHRQHLRRRGGAPGRDVRDALGWNQPFAPEALPAGLLPLLWSADMIAETPEGLRATMRVSSLGNDLFLHSAFPTTAGNSIFFGPDTYRFATFLRARLSPTDRPAFAIDVGTGSGAGAVLLARLARPGRILATDMNLEALQLAAVNIDAAGVSADVGLADGLEDIPGQPDLIVANPPFMIDDDAQRLYRDGGGDYGADLSVQWARAAATVMAVGGRMLLYTGSAIVEGRDLLKAALRETLSDQDCVIDYQELDPDIFGEQLDDARYHDVDRIAAVGAVITKLR